MIGGYNFNSHAFNLATQAERQPGSSFKAFDLAAALEAASSPSTKILRRHSTTPARRAVRHLRRPQRRGQLLRRARSRSRWRSRSPTTACSPRRPEPRSAPRPDRRTSRSVRHHDEDLAQPLDGDRRPPQGVTPLDMAHAYETIAQGGAPHHRTLASYQLRRRQDQRLPWEDAPPAKHAMPGRRSASSDLPRRRRRRVRQPDQRRTHRSTPTTDARPRSMMQGVLPIGTAASAAIPGVAAWGKTGTTSNYADAWFVGSTPEGRQRAVDDGRGVGRLPQRAESMLQNYGGKPVYGGTFPAQIWRSYVEARRSAILPRPRRRASKHPPAPRRLDLEPPSDRPAPPPRPPRRARRPTGTTTPTGRHRRDDAATGTTPTTGTTSPAAGADDPAPPTPASTAAGTTTPATTTPGDDAGGGAARRRRAGPARARPRPRASGARRRARAAGAARATRSGCRRR